MHVTGSHWRITGISVTRSGKGIVLDGSTHTIIRGVDVGTIGAEAVHFRQNSSDGAIVDSVIHDTGLSKPSYGEGVYVGSAKSNWASIMGSKTLPDRSDRVVISNNRISNTSAEGIDIKEGTTGGSVVGNVFTRAGYSGENFADSWVDIKGNGYVVQGNSGSGTKADAFQVHSVLTGWGNGNTFSSNIVTGGVPGYAVWVHSKSSGTVVACGSTAAGLGLSNTVCTDNAAVPTVPAVPWERFTGADRYAVAARVSGEYEPGVPVVYIVKGSDFPDALSAAPAAAAQGGPLLLVQPDAVPALVTAEIERLRPRKIVVVGGTGSVSPSVYDELSKLTPSIHRLGGADRYETSRAVVDYAFGGAGAIRVYLATGSNFPDALSASAAAGTKGGAVLMVRGSASDLDAATENLLRKLRPLDVVIAGGSASVSTGIEAAAKLLGAPGKSFRLGGADRYASSRNINNEAFTAAETVYLATGATFPDALAGAALAGKKGSPLYIVPGGCVPASILADIARFTPSKIVILGGPASVSHAVEALRSC